MNPLTFTRLLWQLPALTWFVVLLMPGCAGTQRCSAHGRSGCWLRLPCFWSSAGGAWPQRIRRAMPYQARKCLFFRLQAPRSGLECQYTGAQPDIFTNR